MTKKQAIELFDTKWWIGKDPKTIVTFQLFEAKLCMPFGDFHEAVEKALGRPVWTHEFAWVDNLRKEFLGERKAPSMREIFELIPESKRILVLVGDKK